MNLNRSRLATRVLPISGAVLLVLGMLFTKFLVNPVYRPIPRLEIAAGASNAAPTSETPFYYLSAPVPALAPWMFPNLPYQKGLPKRFLPRILFGASPAGEELVATFIINGPETLQSELKWNEIAKCFSSWFKCISMRKEFLMRIDRVLSERGIARDGIAWFHVKNPKIFPDEEPKGIRVTGISKNAEGEHVSEAYFILNARNAIQSVILENDLGKKEIHPWLETWMKTARMTTDLNLQQLQAKSSILKTSVTAKSPDEVLRIALIRLSSLLSVDPANVEGWYHLAGVSHELNRRSRQKRQNLAEKRSRLLVQQVERYLQDIAPESARLREVSTLKVELEK